MSEEPSGPPLWPDPASTNILMISLLISLAINSNSAGLWRLLSKVCVPKSTSKDIYLPIESVQENCGVCAESHSSATCMMLSIVSEAKGDLRLPDFTILRNVWLPPISQM